ncbi:MAG: LptE family protein [Candidatus Omnitrophota bacterium]
MRTIIFILIVSFLSGCGYTTRSMIDPNIKTIYIKPFENKIDFGAEDSTYRKLRTYYPRLEIDITNSVVSRFLFDGNLKVVKEKDADVILNGELIEYRRDVLRYDEGENVEEYRLNIVVNISLWNVKEDEAIWIEDGFTGETTYFISGSQAKSESTAIKAGITDLSSRIVARTVENW